MDQLWGLSGSQFLLVLLFPFGFFAALVIMLVAQGVLNRVGSRGADDLQVDLWQAAFVADGYRRVVDTAIAKLVMDRQVLVSRRGELTVATGATPNGPVERAVCVALRGTTSRLTLHRRVRYDPAILAVEAQARSRDLFFSGARALWWRLVALPLLAIVGILVAHTISETILEDLGVLYLVMVLPLWGAIVALIGVRLRVRYRPSPAGRAALSRLDRAYEAVPRVDGGQLAGIAFMGFPAAEDPTLHKTLASTAGSGKRGGPGCGPSCSRGCGRYPRSA